MFDSLGKLLIQIQLLPAEQWHEVRRQLSPDADLRTVLDRIEELPAWWTSGVPALTPYQRKCILRLFDKGLLPRLPRMLRRGDYLILQKLGEGGVGVVFKAWDFQDKRIVAIKQIKQVSIESYRRFRREARIQKRLVHPSIVHFLKLARRRGDTLLVQEYIEGRTIAQEVKARGPIPWQEAAAWIVDVLHALEYAHRLKIIHRDLKPSNIMLHGSAGNLRAKVLDLGLAKCLDPDVLSQTATADVVTIGDALLGTLEYMPPEQWRGAQEIVPASDIYSLGCTLFYALTGGRPPFLANSMLAYCNAHTNTPPPPLNTAPPAVPDAVNTLLQQMLAKVPAKRGSATRLIKQFNKLLRPSLGDPQPRPAESSRSSLPHPTTPARTPTSKLALDLPREASVAPAQANDPFAPFSPDSDVNVSGVKTILRAFLVSRKLLLRLFILVLLALVVSGMLWLCLHV